MGAECRLVAKFRVSGGSRNLVEDRMEARVIDKRKLPSRHVTPREFCTITVTDGMAMGRHGMESSLPSREVIADSVELTMRGHGYDALVGMAGCDKGVGPARKGAVTNPGGAAETVSYADL
jgi:dihydroxyacid dehydratase/phosphogluconate dehydratase